MSNKDQEFPQSYGRNHPAKRPQQDEQAIAKGPKEVDGQVAGTVKAAASPEPTKASAKLPAGPTNPGHAASTATTGEAPAKPANSAARGNDDVMSTPAKQV